MVSSCQVLIFFLQGMQKVALCIQGLGHVSIRSVLRGCNATGGVLFDYFVEFDFHPVLEVRPRRLPGKTISLPDRARPSRAAGRSAGIRAARRPGSCRYDRKEWPVNWLCPDQGREYILDRAWGWEGSVIWGDCGGVGANIRSARVALYSRNHIQNFISVHRSPVCRPGVRIPTAQTFRSSR